MVIYRLILISYFSPSLYIGILIKKNIQMATVQLQKIFVQVWGYHSDTSVRYHLDGFWLIFRNHSTFCSISVNKRLKGAIVFAVFVTNVLANTSVNTVILEPLCILNLFANQVPW